MKIFIKAGPICLLGIFLVAMAHAKNMTEDSKIKWVGKFEQSEKNDLRDFIRQGKKYFVYSRGEPKIFKVDLEKDGTYEYVLTSVYKKLPEDYITDVLVVVRKSKGRLAANDYRSDLGDPGLLHQRKVYLEDFDGDGLIDIIDQRSFHIGGEEPEAFAFILKNNGKKFSPVYEKDSFGDIVLKDLNNDGVKELIETTNEEKLPFSIWQDVYVWRKGKFVKANAEFPDFFLKKRQEYQEPLAWATEGSKNYKKKTGEDNPTYLRIISVLKAHLNLIDEIVKKK